MTDQSSSTRSMQLHPRPARCKHFTTEIICYWDSVKVTGAVKVDVGVSTSWTWQYVLNDELRLMDSNREFLLFLVINFVGNFLCFQMSVTNNLPSFLLFLITLLGYRWKDLIQMKIQLCWSSLINDQLPLRKHLYCGDISHKRLSHQLLFKNAILILFKLSIIANDIMYLLLYYLLR